MSKSRKINARITPLVDKKLQELIRSTGSTMSEVIVTAIEEFYAHTLVPGGKTAYEIALADDLIGCASGPGDLSVRYKAYVQEALEKKYDSR